MTETTTELPKLLKARKKHSRLFVAALILLLLVTESGLRWGGLRFSMIWVGYVLVVLGALGRIYCSVYIGGRKNDVVVRDGPFSIVRNPLYVFSFLAMVGVALQSGMLSLLVLLVVAFMIYYRAVVAKEEAFLTHKFGADYEAYKKEVPRWIPAFRLWREPEQVDAKPLFVRRTLMDAAIFFLPMPLFSILHFLHFRGILPVWLILP